MAEQAGDDALESALEDGSAAEWAAERAAELDLEPHEFLERIMLAYRAAEVGMDADPAVGVEADALEELRTDIEALEDDLDEMIQDVRDRVIQVKRETDAKAPLEHTHPNLADTVERLQGEMEALTERTETTEERLDGGFENFEEILSVLVDRTDEIAEDMETLGEAMVAMKETLETVTAREQGRARADRLKRKGAKHGVRSAKCEECDSKVDLGLLSSASCPTCDATFQDLDPNPGFFSTSTLETGVRPALEAPSDVPSADEIESVATGSERATIPDSEDWFVGQERPASTADEDDDGK